MTGASNRAAHWDAVYTGKADTDVSWYQEVPATSLELIDVSGVGADDTVVDVGAGAAALVDHLVARGYRDIVLVDVSSRGLDVTRQRLGEQPPVRYVVGDALELDMAPVDLWHDRATYHFLVEPAERSRYQQVMARLVRPGGHAIVATFAADGPERCSGLPVVRHSAHALAAAFEPDFAPVTTRRHIHVTPAGAEQPFTYALLRRTP